MKKYFFINLFCGIIVSSVLSSCDDSESSYREHFTRFASVRVSATKVWLDFDCSNETYVMTNFRKHEDLNTFQVHDGSRVLARILYDVPENSTYGTFSIERMDTILSKQIDTNAFQDSLDIFFYFIKTDLGIEYPEVWTADQYLNVSFSYFPNATNPNLTKFYLCPKDVKGDTLRMRLIGENTDTVITSASSKFFAYDMLSLKTVEPENIEIKNNIDNILSTLSSLSNDSIYIEVATPDSLHIYDKNFKGWRGVSGSQRVVKMKNFFK